MNKHGVSCAVMAAFFILGLSPLLSSAEEITVTTYYPSPYGEYNELKTYRNTYLAADGYSVVVGSSTMGSYKLTVEGSLGVNSGTADKTGANTWGTYSDIRLKDVTGEFTPGLEQILNLKPIRYHFKKDNALGFSSDKEYSGFSAQDVQKVIPEAVRENEKGYLMFEADPVLWAMLNAIKELNQKNKELESDNKLLKTDMENLKSELKLLKK